MAASEEGQTLGGETPGERKTLPSEHFGVFLLCEHVTC